MLLIILLLALLGVLFILAGIQGQTIRAYIRSVLAT